MNACETKAFQAAIDACLDYAKTHLHRTTVDIAGVMEVSSLDAVYKWTQSARLPLLEIPNFERACGSVFVSKQLAAFSGHMLIKEPTADGLASLDFSRMHWQVAKAMLATTSAIVDPLKSEEAAIAITVAIEALVTVRQQLLQVTK